ncbi:MAG: OmpA family protein [Prevotella sp.]|nr:OmpA family protein [Prevotella sp.]
MKRKILTFGLCAALLIGCNNMQKGAGIGAGGGAALGAVVGALFNGGSGALVGAAIGTAVGAGAGALIGKKMDKVKAQAEQVKNAQVETVTDANGLQAVKVSFDSGLLFATSSAELNATVKQSLNDFANVVSQNQDCDIQIFGHTDNTGWKNKSAAESEKLNLELSQKRAQSVANYLTSHNVPYSILKGVQGMGQTSPIADNSTADGRQQNRRVEVYMYASQKMIDQANNGTLQ